RDVPDLPALDDAERAELSRMYPELFRRLENYFTDASGAPLELPYVAAWHQAPVHAASDDHRLHLRVHSTRRAPDRLKHLAASETAMGAWINPAVPEEIAARLRESAP